MSKRRTITMTETEFEALLSAASMHEYEFEDEPTAESRAVDRALTRLIQKWYKAGSMG